MTETTAESQQGLTGLLYVNTATLVGFVILPAMG